MERLRENDNFVNVILKIQLNDTRRDIEDVYMWFIGANLARIIRSLIPKQSLRRIQKYISLNLEGQNLQNFC